MGNVKYTRSKEQGEGFRRCEICDFFEAEGGKRAFHLDKVTGRLLCDECTSAQDSLWRHHNFNLKHDDKDQGLDDLTLIADGDLPETLTEYMERMKTAVEPNLEDWETILQEVEDSANE